MYSTKKNSIGLENHILNIISEAGYKYSVTEIGSLENAPKYYIIDMKTLGELSLRIEYSSVAYTAYLRWLDGLNSKHKVLNIPSKISHKWNLRDTDLKSFENGLIERIENVIKAEKS